MNSVGIDNRLKHDDNDDNDDDSADNDNAYFVDNDL